MINFLMDDKACQRVIEPVGVSFPMACHSLYLIDRRQIKVEQLSSEVLTPERQRYSVFNSPCSLLTSRLLLVE